MMNNFIFGVCIIFCVKTNKCRLTQEIKQPQPSHIKIDSFQNILNEANLNGAILIYDTQKATYYSNDLELCTHGQIPASTFKMPHSMIALELEIVDINETIFKWDGQPRTFKMWETDLTFKEAFHKSCVPCYQEIARKIGPIHMRSMIDTIHYGHMRFDSNTIDNFWLRGESKISAYEQIDFLKRFYDYELPISNSTYLSMRDLIIVSKTEKYILSGKTGWAMNNEDNLGWFVGYVEKNDNIFYFATQVSPKPELNMDDFPEIRKTVTYDALRYLGGWD